MESFAESAITARSHGVLKTAICATPDSPGYKAESAAEIVLMGQVNGELAIDDQL